MQAPKKESLTQRMIHAAESVLDQRHYFSLIDVLCSVGRLHQSNVESWKRGHLDILETMIQGNPDKLAEAIHSVRRWAVIQGLEPVEAPYVRSTRTGPVELRFTVSGDPDQERMYGHILSLPSCRRNSSANFRKNSASLHTWSYFRSSATQSAPNAASNYGKVVFSTKRANKCYVWPVPEWTNWSFCLQATPR
jgi:hypothetical protein